MGQQKQTKGNSKKKEARGDVEVRFERGRHGETRKRDTGNGQWTTIKKGFQEVTESLEKPKAKYHGEMKTEIFNRELKPIDDIKKSVTINGITFDVYHLTTPAVSGKVGHDHLENEVYIETGTHTEAHTLRLEGEIPLDDFLPFAGALVTTLQESLKPKYSLTGPSASTGISLKANINKHKIEGNFTAEIGCKALSAGVSIEPSHSLSVFGFNFKLKEMSVNAGVGANGKVAGNIDFDLTKYRMQLHVNIGAFSGIGVEGKVVGGLQLDANLPERIAKRTDEILTQFSLGDKKDLIAFQRLLDQSTAEATDGSWWSEYWKQVKNSAYQETIDDIHATAYSMAAAKEMLPQFVKENETLPLDASCSLSSAQENSMYAVSAITPPDSEILESIVTSSNQNSLTDHNQAVEVDPSVSQSTTTFQVGLSQNLLGHPTIQAGIERSSNDNQTQIGLSANTNGQESSITITARQSEVSHHVNEVNGEITVLYTTSRGMEATASGGVKFSEDTSITVGASTSGVVSLLVSTPLTPKILVAGATLVGILSLGGVAYWEFCHVREKREAHKIPYLDYTLKENKNLALNFYNLSKKISKGKQPKRREIRKIKRNIEKSRNSATTPEQHQINNVLTFVVENLDKEEVRRVLCASYSKTIKYHKLVKEEFLRLNTLYDRTVAEAIQPLQDAYNAGEIGKAQDLCQDLLIKFPENEVLLKIKNYLDQTIKDNDVSSQQEASEENFKSKKEELSENNLRDQAAKKHNLELFISSLKKIELVHQKNGVSDLLASLPNVLSELQNTASEVQQYYIHEIKHAVYSLGEKGDLATRKKAIDSLTKIQRSEAQFNETYSEKEKAMTFFYMGVLEDKDAFFNHSKATRHYEEATKLDPSSTMIAGGYIDTLCKQGQFKEAEKVRVNCLRHNQLQEFDSKTSDSKIIFLENKKREIQQISREVKVFYGRLKLRVGVKTAKFLVKNFLKYFEKLSEEGIIDEEKIKDFFNDIDLFSSSIFDIYFSTSFLGRISSLAHIAYGITHSKGSWFQEVIKKINEKPMLAKLINLAPVITESMTGGSIFYHAAQSSIMGYSSNLSSFNSLMHNANIILFIPGVAHRHYFNQRRAEGNAPTNLLGIIGEDIARLGGNGVTTTALFLHASSVPIQVGAGYVGNLMISHSPIMLTQMVQNSELITFVVNAPSAIATYSSEIASAAVANAKTTFLALTPIGQVAIASGILAAGGMATYKFYWHRKFQNELHNAKTNLDLVATDYTNAETHFKSAKASMTPLLENYSQNADVQKVLRDIQDSERILQEAKKVTNKEDNAHLMLELDKLEEKSKERMAIILYSEYTQQSKNAQVGLKKIRENQDYDNEYLTKLKELTLSSYCGYQVANRYLLKNFKKKGLLELIKNNITYQLELTLLGESNANIAEQLLIDLKKLSPKDQDAVLYSRNISILSENPDTRVGLTVIMTELAQLDEKERLRYGYAINNKLVEKEKSISENILQVKLDKNKNKEEKSIAIKQLSEELYKVKNLRYLLITQEADRYSSNMHYFITRLNLGVEQQENQEKILITIIEKKLNEAKISLEERLSLECVDKIKEIAATLGKRENCGDRGKIKEVIKAIGEYDITLKQKSQTQCYLGDISKLDVYLYRQEILDYYKSSFELNPDFDSAKNYVDECCNQACYSDALSALNVVLRDRENLIQCSQNENEKSEIGIQISKINNYKNEVNQRRLNSYVLLFKSFIWIAKRSSSRIVEKRLTILEAMLNLPVQVYQYKNLPEDASEASLKINQTNFIYSVLNIILMFEAEKNNVLPKNKLANTSFWVEVYQMCTSTVNAYRGLHESCFAVLRGLPLQQLPPKIAIELVSFMYTPASFFKKHWFDKKRAEGKAPSSIPLIALEKVTQLLCCSAFGVGISIYSNAVTLSDWLGFSLRNCSPKVGNMLEAYSSKIVKSSIKLVFESKRKWRLLSNSHKNMIMLSGALMSAMLLRQYLNSSWYHNIFENTRIVLGRAICDWKNSTQYLDEVRKNFNTIYKYHSQDKATRQLEDIFHTIDKSMHADAEMLIILLSDLDGYLKRNNGEVLYIGLARIHILKKLISISTLSYQDKCELASGGVNTLNELTVEGNLPEEIQEYLKQCYLEFACIRNPSYVKEENGKTVENCSIDNEEQSENNIFYTIARLQGLAGIIIDPAFTSLCIAAELLYKRVEVRSKTLLSTFSIWKRFNKSAFNSEQEENNALDSENNHKFYVNYCA